MKALTSRTVKQYGNDFQSFRDWCESTGRSWLPSDSATVLRFVQHEMQRGLAVPTIGRRIAAIRYAHLIAGHAAPTEDPRIRATLDDAETLRPTTSRLTLSGFAALGNSQAVR
ncbi:site-specific integrase [Roseiterribacter gracilis]|uniref:Core-binding (CB) domain-containing protein n=1 Tax=Roseiterribacter gracilis TaxID=2812848 RepID=A0A8S8XA94_9PROT|nr:hypothetical protein TMPK1_19110 [Rhodospirillales bacterium TMPK1]